MTGTGDNTQVYGKLVELLKETVPGMFRVAYLRNPDTPGTDQQMARSRDAATQLGLTFLEVQVRAPEQVHAAIASAVAEHADGIAISADTVFSLATHPNPVLTDAIAYHLPTMYSQVTGSVDHGGLMAFSPDFVASQRRAAAYVDKILRGARP